MPEAEAKVPEVLTRKVGPLPAWAWVAAIGGGLGIAFLLRRQRSGKPAEPVFTPALSPPDAYMRGAAPSLGVTAAGQGVVPGAPAPTTNSEWGRAAILSLIGMGYGAVESGNAINNYLSGSATTQQDSALIEAAMRRVGPPPILPPTSVTPIPPTTTAPPASPTVPSMDLSGSQLLTSAGVFRPLPGFKYSLSIQPTGLDVPGELYVSVGGVWYKVPGANAFSFGALQPGVKYFLTKIGDAPGGPALVEAPVGDRILTLQG